MSKLSHCPRSPYSPVPADPVLASAPASARSAGRRSIAAPLILAALLACPLLDTSPAAAEEPIDLDMVTRIRDEGFNRSQVMATVRHLTDHIGPRLTASPQMRQAGRWTLAKMREWGLSNVHAEGFEFGRGWSFSRVAVHMLSPHKVPLLVIPDAWTPGTEGAVRGQAIRVDISGPDDFERYRGKLSGKVLFLDKAATIEPKTEPLFRRMSSDDLDKLSEYPVGGNSRRANWRKRFAKRFELARQMNKFLAVEKPLAVVRVSSRDGGLLRTRLRVRGFDRAQTPSMPHLTMAIEHYNRILRLLEDGLTVELEVDIGAQFHDRDDNAYNIIGDLPGTTLRNQIVLAGAHLDSWHGATGAGDNAAGVAVVMEAVRILKAVGARPRRTIRIGLWSGEEQGLLGSKAYVERHFVTRAKPKPGVSPFAPEMRNRPFRVKKAHAQLSAYFNLDNGTGKIRGIYAEGNAAAAAIFRAWLRPFHDLDATLVTLRPTVATDHRSFDEVGLPGFQFVQDRLDYFPRLHHTNIDGYDHIYSEELMQASVIMAAFLYHAATRQSRLPRKPMPTFPGRAKASGSAKSPARTGPVRTGPGRGQAPARPGPRPVSRPR